MRDTLDASRSRWGLIAPFVALLASVMIPVASAWAGCGCEKPAPPLASIRPAFASVGSEVTLFASAFQPGEVYSVSFEGSTVTQTVDATVVLKRDFADGVVKPQLVVTVPPMPAGPTAVQAGNVLGPALELSMDEFTVLPPPMPLLEGKTKTLAKSYQGVAGADGTVYIPVDITPVAKRVIFRGRFVGYRLLFDAADIVIYNTQGVLMQTLSAADEGVLYEIDDDPDEAEDAGDGAGLPSAARSFRLTYDRHEFQTYLANHENDPLFALDPSDPAWHVNGTRHIDHFHLVIAIQATVADTESGTVGTPLPPGLTPAFDFRIKTDFELSANQGPRVKRVLDWPSIVGQAGGERTPLVCAALPLEPCRQPISPRRSTIDIRDASSDKRDALAWRWTKGAATQPEDFGDVLGNHALAACLYDESGETPQLLVQSSVMGGALCGAKEKACWRGVGRPRGVGGYRFKDRAGASDGIAQIVLNPGGDGKTQIVFKARGRELGLPEMPFGTPLRMQLQSATGQCWEAVFDANVTKSTDERFKAKSE